MTVATETNDGEIEQSGAMLYMRGGVGIAELQPQASCHYLKHAAIITALRTVQADALATS